MQKFYILCSLLLLFSCGKELSVNSDQISSNNLQGGLELSGGKIGYEKALSIAQSVPSRFSDKLTKAIFKTPLSGQFITSSGTSTKSGNTSVDTLMYIFNYAEGGYAVVPSLAVENDLIAYVEEGVFNIQDTADNDLSKFLVSQMIDYQQSMIEKFRKESVATKGSSSLNHSNYPMYGPKCGDVIAASGIHFQNLGEPTQTPEYIARKGDDYYKNNGCYMPLEYTYIDESYREPLLKTTWGQGKPYNSGCPGNSKAGCVAIAVSQIMAYHAVPAKYPSAISSFDVPDYLTVYVGTITAISDLRRRKTISSPAAKEFGPRFIAIIGHMLKNDWGTESTGAKDKEVPKVFNNMGYAVGSLVDYNGHDVEAALNDLRPVYITGRKPGMFSTSGHAWVVDGYKLEDNVSQDYIYFFDEYGIYHGRRLREPYGGHDTHSVYFHHNFGWSDTWNGYYLDGVFDTTKIHEATGKTSPENRVYNRIEIIPSIVTL